MDQSSQPSITVVMPVGSVDSYFRKALACLVGQQTALDWDLVVSLNSDDGNARSALESVLAKTSLNAEVVDSSDIRSASYARNTGAKHATGDILAFCDSDDEADPLWLENIVTALGPRQAVGGHLSEERLVVAGQEHWRPPATPGELPSFLGVPYLVSANMAVWAEDFHAVEGFDQTLLRGEDIDFSWKLVERGVELRYVQDAVVEYRHRAGLRPLLHQHYLYGRGMGQVLARRNPPGADGPQLLRANGQSVPNKSAVHIMRRGSIALGRLRGLVDARSIEPAPPVPTFDTATPNNGTRAA